MSGPKTKNRNQERAGKIVAQNARGVLFINLPAIELSRVNTSTLCLLYKAVSNNMIVLLNTQNAITEELSHRAKQQSEWSLEKTQSLRDTAQRLSTESGVILNEIKTEQANRAEKKRKRGKRPKLPNVEDFSEVESK